MTVKGNAVPFLQPNTDTDVIIPARFLKRTALDGFEPFAFFEKRYLPTTRCEPSLEARDFVFQKVDLDPACPLNHPHAAGATVLVTFNNFGCGSSREHAVYALRNFRVIVGSAPQGKSAFADIFRDNCRQNLIWTPVLSEKDHGALVEALQRGLAKGPVSVELDTDKQVLRMAGAGEWPFDIPAHHRDYILNGKDPFDTAREQVSSQISVIRTWFGQSPTFGKDSPSTLK